MNEDEMPGFGNDETLRDVIASLGKLPPVSESDVQAIVARAAAEAAESGRRSEHRWAARPLRDARSAATLARPARPRWFAPMPMAAAAALVLAAGIGGFMLRGSIPGSAPQAAQVAVERRATSSGAAMATSVAADPSAEAPLATQFVLEAPAAASVSLVGAFNSWDADATPLVHDPATGLWTVTVPLAPGRHVYAFMVDDTVLTLDPRAPATRDPELGTSGSVILVGTP